MLDFYAQIYPRAKKEHKCAFCYQVIPKGKRYSFEIGKYGADLFTRKLCSECDALLQDFCQNNEDGFKWFEISTWLRKSYCYNCPNMEVCEISPKQCDMIKNHYPSEITKERIKQRNKIRFVSGGVI